MRRAQLIVLVLQIAGSCAPSHHPQTSALQPATVATDGGRLAYIEEGRGSAVILIHGGFQDYRMWLPFIGDFARRHRVIAYSRSNHYPNSTSPGGTPDYAADRHAADLAQLAQALELLPADIVAHSSGAATALFLASRNPEAVRSLVIVEPPVASLLTQEPGDQAALNDFMARFSLAIEALKTRNDADAVRLFADAVGGPGTYDRRTAEQKAMMRDNIEAHVADATSPEPRPRFTCAMARRIRAPVLLVSGSRSPAFFHRIADRLAACLSDVRRVTVDSSHSVPGENEAAFRALVLDFLTRARPVGPRRMGA